MLYHYKLEHPALILACPEPNCKESFVYEFELRRHLKKVHEFQSTHAKYTRSAQCPFCARVYSASSHLKFHMEEKHPDKVSVIPRYHCEVPNCGASFSQKRLLQYHVRSKHPKARATNKPLTMSECPICHASFFKVGEHMRSMHDVPSVCRFCFKVFEDKAELKQHRLIHFKKTKFQKSLLKYTSPC